MKQYCIILGLFLGIAANAQTQREIYNESVKAYENKDYKTFLKLTQKLDSLRPFHPSYTYNLASAYALNDEAERSVETLTKMVLFNNTLTFDTDEDFKSINQSEQFRALVKLKSSQERVITTSKPEVTLSEKELHPEGVTYLPQSKTWLASSIRKRKIVSFDIKTGQCTDWLKAEDMLSVLAMKADAKETVLWVATAAFPEMENFDKSLKGKAEVLKVDIRTKKILKRFPVEGNHVFGDLIVAKNGVVYVSDSGTPRVYTIANDTLSEFVSFETDGFNLQGLAFNAEQDQLFIADYLKGIAVIDMKSKAKTWLSFPKGTSPKGIDGLVFYKNSLIAIQNGVKPIRITRLQLNAKQNEITGFKILDNNRPEFNEPALGTLIGPKLYFFANSPWNAYNDNGVLDSAKVTNPVLFSCLLD